MPSRVDQYRKKFSTPVDRKKYNKAVTQAKDPRIWNIDPDNEGNASAQIRFLPRPLDDKLTTEYDIYDDFVCQISHYYKNSSRSYVEISRRTWNEPDPVNDFNNEIYNRDENLYKNIVSCNGGTRRRVSYYSNIYVINDVRHPENNGKVFLFRFGPQIKAKIQECVDPKDKLETPMDPFDIFNGPSFRYISSKKSTYVNYEKSRFELNPTSLTDDEKLMEDILNQCYSLREFIDIKKMKSYDELYNRFISVMGENDYYKYLGMANPNASVHKESPVITNTVEDVDDDELSEKELEDILS